MSAGQGAVPPVAGAIVRMRARVEGRVQGVAYRASTQHRARSLGLTGWVRNQADGAVELEAQGPAAAVAALLAWCRHGPSLAVVGAVVHHEVPTLDGESGFDVWR